MVVGLTSNSNNIHGFVDDNINPYKSMMVVAITINHNYSDKGSRNIFLSKKIKLDYISSEVGYDSIIEWLKV